VKEVAHTRWWQIFEVVFGLPFLAAIALQRVLPLSLPRGRLTPVFVVAGMALIGVGAGMAVLARRELARQGQPTDPGLPTSKLVTTGVFSISRNPLYLGGISILAGIALAFNLPWVSRCSFRSWSPATSSSSHRRNGSSPPSSARSTSAMPRPCIGGLAANRFHADRSTARSASFAGEQPPLRTGHVRGRGSPRGRGAPPGGIALRMGTQPLWYTSH